MDPSVKEEPSGVQATEEAVPHGAWVATPVSTPQTITLTTIPIPVPPPAHSLPAVNAKPPETYIEKALLETTAAYQDPKTMALPLKAPEPTPPTTDNSGALSWALQSSLLQQYGQFMLDRMLNKASTEAGVAAATSSAATNITAAEASIASALAGLTTTSNGAQSLPESLVKAESESETTPTSATLEAQQDIYRRMLNYSMTSALAAQTYYLQQYGYNYLQERTAATRAETVTTATATTVATPAVTLSIPQTAQQQQLPSIDSVLLNLSTKKTREATPTATATATTIPVPISTIVAGSSELPGTSNIYGNGAVTVVPTGTSVPAYGLQALANAAIEADPKAFSESQALHVQTVHRDTLQKTAELEDISDTDEQSDSSTSQIQSPPRSAYSHILENHPHISIPTAHSQYSVYPQNLLAVSKSGVGTLPGIQHFSTLGQQNTKVLEPTTSLQIPQASVIRPADAHGMKLKVEPAEEREMADRAIQEKIAAHHLNAVQQQVQDLTAAGGLDAAALLAKLPVGTNLEAELQRHLAEGRIFDFSPDAAHALQEPMELTSDISPGKVGSRRKSRGRPTSIESQRDPLGRQSSTSSLGANTSVSGDERTYDCEVCGKQFSHNDRLRRHRKIHTNEKPYKCDICGKGFKEKCNLKHHRYIHTGEKPYKCMTCGKAFNQRSSLKTHQKVHTGEKPFKCDLCEKPFAQKYLLRQHMKKHVELPQAVVQQ